MTIWGIMALEIGGEMQIQPDFGATKFVAVLIFAIFCPPVLFEGSSQDLQLAPQPLKPTQ